MGMNEKICKGYLEGEISHAVFIKEFTRVYGNDSTSTPIEKSDDELIEKSLQGDDESYTEWNRRYQVRQFELRKANEVELQIVQEEFDHLLATTIRKEHESREEVANRVWLMKSSNGETLIERYQNAYRGVQL